MTIDTMPLWQIGLWWLCALTFLVAASIMTYTRVVDWKSYRDTLKDDEVSQFQWWEAGCWLIALLFVTAASTVSAAAWKKRHGTISAFHGSK